MQTQQQIWKSFQEHNVARFIVKIAVIAVFGLLSLGTMVPFAHANACSSGDRIYRVVGGDTLGEIGARFGVSVATLASHNAIADPNLIYVDQMLCIPWGGSSDGGGNGNTSSGTGNTPPPPSFIGYNPFPYGSCTWWADQRYYQMHGVFVPWRVNANAWQWTARAYNFSWHVSSQPAVGSIIDLQGGVQGAGWLGHVGFVEEVLDNNQVIASSMNWGYRPWAVTYWRFTPGQGVTFISQ